MGSMSEFLFVFSFLF